MSNSVLKICKTRSLVRPSCGLSKPIEEFYKNKLMPDGHHNQCKACHKQYEYSHKEQRKNNKLLYDYGITLDQYNKMFADQNGCCGICQRHQSELKKILFVDHDHKTQQVRKLLCENCNTLIGHAREDLQVLERAMKYLQEF